MHIEIIQDNDSFKKFESDWNSLIARAKISNPFQRFEWMNAWVESYPDDYSLYLMTVTDNNRLIAIAPLAKDKQTNNLVFMGFPFNDIASIILTEKPAEALELILEHLFQRKSEWHIMHLDQIPESAPCLAYLMKPEIQKKYHVHITASDSCPSMVIDNPEEALEKYNKKHLRTHINWFQKQGKLIFKVHESKETILPAMESLFKLHIDRRDKTPFPSHFTQEKHKKFYRRFVQTLTSIDRVKLFELRLGDHTDLAMFLALMNTKTLFLYTTGFEDAFAKRSPGQIILKYMMEYVLEKNITTIDFARGDEGYKDRYTNTIKQNYLVNIYPGMIARTGRALYYSFKHTRLIDLLYRNKKVQSMKFVFLYQKRVAGIGAAVRETIKTLFSKS